MPMPQGADGQRTWKVVGSLVDVVSQVSGLRNAGAAGSELEAGSGAWFQDHLLPCVREALVRTSLTGSDLRG